MPCNGFWWFLFLKHAFSFLFRLVIYIHKGWVYHLKLGLRYEALATKRLNCFMRTIYQHDVYLPKVVAAEVADHLYFFVRSYLFQAHCAYQKNLSYFHLIPKLHGLHEIAHSIRRQTRCAEDCINPAIYICCCDEDFIGRLAYVSRQVSPRVIARRTLQRYLCHIQIIWARGG